MVVKLILKFASLAALGSCIDLTASTNKVLRQVAPASVALNTNSPFFSYTGNSSFGTLPQATSGTIFDSSQSLVQAS